MLFLKIAKKRGMSRQIMDHRQLGGAPIRIYTTLNVQGQPPNIYDHGQSFWNTFDYVSRPLDAVLCASNTRLSLWRYVERSLD